MTRIYYLLPLIILFISCKNKQPNSCEIDIDDAIPVVETVVPEFQTILDSAKVSGSILIFDLNNNHYHSNDFKWAKQGHLPASTFKITNSMIALETGVVENDSTLFPWDGEPRRMEAWEQDLILKEAFHFSCVPCYQEIARKIGTERMNEYLDKLEYGEMQVDSSNIDLFWLQGASRISQFQQVDFLKRFYQSELPISDQTENIMKRMMVIEENEEFTLTGKTGWSTTDNVHNTWFVGYIENQKKTYFFATNIEPTEQFDMRLLPSTRKTVTMEALRQLEILK